MAWKCRTLYRVKLVIEMHNFANCLVGFYLIILFILIEYAFMPWTVTALNRILLVIGMKCVVKC
jgi:hypothetical protein